MRSKCAAADVGTVAVAVAVADVGVIVLHCAHPSEVIQASQPNVCKWNLPNTRVPCCAEQNRN